MQNTDERYARIAELAAKRDKREDELAQIEQQLRAMIYRIDVEEREGGA